ncbi:hypothetical protein ASG30_13725 [Ramlibacter sp. Leaf400]|nr:hypothetical protein ASG30_13725 [Ramlibacter sp. Leaf400]
MDAPRDPQRRQAARRWLALGGVAGLAASGAALLRGGGSAAPVARAPSAGSIPDVPLVTHDGRKVRFYSDLVRGRVVFVNMMYAQCSEQCPPMTQNLRRVHEALGSRAGQDIFMYSITLLPEFDSPADLRAYREQQGANWTFLTGRKADVEQLRRGLGFSDPDPQLDADITRHTGMVRVGNDALDRWTMAPARVSPNQILECLISVDPRTRATGRIRVA